MINNAQRTTVLPVVDVTRAADFYRDRLGLADLRVDTTGNQVPLTGAGTQIALMTAEAGGLRETAPQHSGRCWFSTTSRAGCSRRSSRSGH